MAQCIKVDPTDMDAALSGAVVALQTGELVAFPTETVYGLGANALDEEAVMKVFAAKGRPADNPLIVHFSSQAMLQAFISYDNLSPSIVTLMDTFWPGPLTLLVPMIPSIAPSVSCGQPLLAVRVPDNPIAQRLIDIAGVPVAAPSANVSGRPSPTTASHVLHDLGSKVAYILDGGQCNVGVESTVIDATRVPPLILRPGGVSLEQLSAVLPVVALDENLAADLSRKPPTPGLKYRHYSPKAKVVLVDGIEAVTLMAEKGEKVGLLHVHPHISLPPCTYTQTYGYTHTTHTSNIVVCDLVQGNCVDLDVVARCLYGALRELDEYGVDTIFVETVSEEGKGMAIMNRLRKASK